MIRRGRKLQMDLLWGQTATHCLQPNASRASRKPSPKVSAPTAGPSSEQQQTQTRPTTPKPSKPAKPKHESSAKAGLIRGPALDRCRNGGEEFGGVARDLGAINGGQKH